MSGNLNNNSWVRFKTLPDGEEVIANKYDILRLGEHGGKCIGRDVGGFVLFRDGSKSLLSPESYKSLRKSFIPTEPYEKADWGGEALP